MGDWFDPKRDTVRLVLVGVGLTLVVLVGVAASTSAAAFGVYNAAWDGSADLRDVATEAGAQPIVRFETAAYTETTPNQTIAVVLSPTTAYNASEQSAVRRFVRAGGTLVVAEDSGPHSDALLSGIGAQTRVDGRVLRDERHYYRGPSLPVATNATATAISTDRTELVLNYGTALEPNGATVAVRSSEYAYLDTNRNGALDGNETLGSYPVVTVERVGAGTVITVGDPSAFINTMLERPGNRRFVRALFGAHETVVLDYSHAGDPPALVAALVVLRESAPLQALVGTLGIGIVLLLTSHRSVWARLRSRRDENGATDLERTETSEALARSLARRYPQWDEERLRHAITAIMTVRRDGDDDE